MKLANNNLIIAFLISAAAVLFSGCAETAPSHTAALLSAAGFKTRTPETPKQKQIYAALPTYKVERATVKDKVFYVYKDEKAGIAYIGREPEYQRYQQLAIQQHIAQKNYMAAEMGREAALGFNGQFGMGGVW